MARSPLSQLLLPKAPVHESAMSTSPEAMMLDTSNKEAIEELRGVFSRMREGGTILIRKDDINKKRLTV